MKTLDSLADRWPALNSLLDQALALSASERSAWLDGLPAEAVGLRNTLQALLASHASVETGDFLGTLPKFAPGGAENEAAVAADAREGDAVGPYRLLRLLGRGGMGDVWLAERADGELKRQVALKLPRVAWGGGLAERLRRERDILASLAHPHIARLYDAGVDAHGRPYLALEYVEGQPIDMYCREHGLPPNERLDLLLQVAAAVAHAHARLVVHRDLKPSNILVTAEGEVRLLDFGIAKIMQGERTADTALTQLSGRAMTLDYASPEQILGEPLGTTSDVYSLAVVAYELLAGAKPYRLKRGSQAELEEAIAQTDPPRASDAADSPLAKRQLRGDLDAILNKALKKDPAQRYPTVAAFAEDLQRHRDGRAVHALPDSRLYRTRKFVRRNRIAVAMSSALLATIVAGSAVAVWQALVAREQAANAVASAGRLDGIVELYVETMTSLAVMGTENPAALAEPRAVTRVLQEKLREMAPRFATLPEGRGGQLQAVSVQLNFGNEFEASLAIGREYLAHLQAHGASAYSLMQAHEMLGRTLFQLRRLEESEAIRRAGIDAAGPTDDARTEQVRLSLMTDLGSVLNTRGKRNEAEAVLMRGEVLAERMFPQAPVRHVNLFRLADVYLGFDDARALSVARRAHVGLVAGGAGNPELEAFGLAILGKALLANGAALEAEPLLRKALAITVESYGRNSRNGARALAQLAEAMARQGKHVQLREMLQAELRALPGTAGGPSAFAPLLRARQIENEWLYGDVSAATSLVAADSTTLLQPKTIRDNYTLVLFEALALAGAGRGREALAFAQALHRAWPERDLPTAAWLRIVDALVIASLAAGENAAAGETARGLLGLLEQQQASSGWAYRSTAEMAALASARAGDLPGAMRALAQADAITTPPPPLPVARAESALRRAEVLAALGRPADALAAGRAALADLADQHPASPRLVRARQLAGFVAP